MLRVSYIIITKTFDIFEQNLILDEIDAYAEYIRVPLLSRIP